MATAQSYQANLPSTELPDAYHVRSDGFGATGQDFASKIVKFFGGSDLEQHYQNLLSQNERAYNQALLREQRAYEEYVRNREYEREDTTYQRLRKDLEAAGINPLYALQGGLSGTSARTGMTGTSNNVHDSSAERVKSKQSASGIAALLMAVAKVIAM